MSFQGPNNFVWKAKHFWLEQRAEGDLYHGCYCDDGKCGGKTESLQDLPRDSLFFPPVTFKDLSKASTSVTPEVNKSELEEMRRMTAQREDFSIDVEPVSAPFVAISCSAISAFLKILFGVCILAFVGFFIYIFVGFFGSK